MSNIITGSPDVVRVVIDDDEPVVTGTVVRPRSSRAERGVVSAEWAVAIIAAIAIAAVLVNFIAHGAFGDVFTNIVLNIIKTIATVGRS
jgi:hypothetical protein